MQQYDLKTAIISNNFVGTQLSVRGVLLKGITPIVFFDKIFHT